MPKRLSSTESDICGGMGDEAAERGGGECHARRFAGHEVGGDQPDALARFVDGGHLQAVDGFP